MWRMEAQYKKKYVEQSVLITEHFFFFILLLFDSFTYCTFTFTFFSSPVLSNKTPKKSTTFSVMHLSATWPRIYIPYLFRLHSYWPHFFWYFFSALFLLRLESYDGYTTQELPSNLLNFVLFFFSSVYKLLWVVSLSIVYGETKTKLLQKSVHNIH